MSGPARLAGVAARCVTTTSPEPGDQHVPRAGEEFLRGVIARGAGERLPALFTVRQRHALYRQEGTVVAAHGCVGRCRDSA